MRGDAPRNVAYTCVTHGDEEGESESKIEGALDEEEASRKGDGPRRRCAQEGSCEGESRCEAQAGGEGEEGREAREGGKAAKAAKAAKVAKPAKTVSAAKKPKAAAKKPAAAAPVKKAAAKKPAAAAPVKKAAAKPIQVLRRDGAGHLNPKYAHDLLEQAGRAPAEPAGFLEHARSSDDLVEELGEEVVATATTGEAVGEDVLNQEVAEEVGGPFVETTGRDEFAHGVDPSNPKGAKREPFPRT